MSVIIAERFSKVFAAMKLLALERWPEGDLKSDELRKLRMLMTGIRIGELEEVEGFFEGFREEEGNGLGWAKLLILTYHNLYQTEKLIRLVLADSINVSAHMAFWKKRNKRHFWFLYEKTPLFWWRYFRGEAIHPQRELNDNLKKLVTFDDLSMTLLGNIYFNLTPPSSFEDIYRINRDTILSCRKFFSQGVDTDNEIRGTQELSRIYKSVKELHTYIENYADIQGDWKTAASIPFTQRNWLWITLGCIGTYYAAKYASLHVVDIKEGIKEVFDAGLVFVQTQMKTLGKAIETIRYEQNEDLLEMQMKAVHASEESLARMVVDFNKQHVPSLDPDYAKKLEIAARYGDLSTIMPSYEKEIEQPIKGALFGEFVRLVLIQVQKQKVDLERAMLQLDKLLRTNELNFTVLALLPAFLVAYILYQLATRERSNSRVEGAIRDSLRQVHFLLNRNNAHGNYKLSSPEYGRLIVSLNKLREYSQFLKETHKAWLVEDLQEIETEKYSVTQRLVTVERMYRTYKFLGI